VLGEWRLIAGWTAAAAAGSAALALLLAPDRFLGLVAERPGLWLAIMTLYPPLSALPQEIIYRSLFFERYGGLFASDRARIAVNGALFGLGHLFFLHPVTIATTALGGAAIGWAYLRGRSLPLAVVLHAVAGNAIFTAGLGAFFYHGAIER
jgi:membrane protease YdiL (CAAX protease family)